MSTRVYTGQLESISDDEVAGIAISAGVKRDGDEWVPSGIDLTQFKRNLVILRDHDHCCVIGTATAIGLTDDGSAIGIRIQFAPPGVSDVADEARALAKAGILRGISAGISPFEWEALGDGSYGRRITSAELLEVSLVAVGADADALVTARALRSRPTTLAMLRSLPKVSVSAQERALARVRPPPPAPSLLSPHAQREVERQRNHTLAVYGLQQ